MSDKGESAQLEKRISSLLAAVKRLGGEVAELRENVTAIGLILDELARRVRAIEAMARAAKTGEPLEKSDLEALRLGLAGSLQEAVRDIDAALRGMLNAELEKINSNMSLLVEEYAKMSQEVAMFRAALKDFTSLNAEELKELKSEVYSQKAAIHNLSLVVYGLEGRLRELEEKVLPELKDLKLLSVYSEGKAAPRGAPRKKR